MPNSSFTKYPSYNFNGKVPDDMSAEHSWIQSQAPMLKDKNSTGNSIVINGNVVPIPLFFETNDLLQTPADLTNVLEIYGDNSRSVAPFTQKRSGLLTTIDTPNRVTIQNQRDITSYVVGEQSIYNTEFGTIQDAITQAVSDGVDSSANPRREVFIIIRPGVYPNNFTVPFHGIHLIGMTSGVTKDVTISGNVIIAPNDSPGKTIMLLRGLHFTGTIDINTPVAFNPKVHFDDCLLEGIVTVSATMQTIELSFMRSLVQGNMNITGGSVSLTISNNCIISTINIDLTDSFTLTANMSFFNLYITGTTIIPNIVVRAFMCFFGLALFVPSPGVTSYANQLITLQIIACQLGGTTVYGSLDASNSIISHSNIAFLELGDPSTLNIDDYYSYSANSATSVIKPFLISHCVFGEVRLNMKCNISDTPQIVTFDQCTFDIESNRSRPSLLITDLSTTYEMTSPQTVNITKCSIIGAVSVNLDPLGVAIPGGANLFMLFAQCICNIFNINFPAVAPYACIVGGSFGAFSPVPITILQNIFTLNDTMTDYVVNGLGNGINLTYLDGTGTSFGNIITNANATIANISTGTVITTNQGVLL